MSLKTTLAMALCVSTMSPALADNSDSAGALEFLAGQAVLQRLDFRAQVQASDLPDGTARPITVSREAPKFKPITIWLNMGTGF